MKKQEQGQGQGQEQGQSVARLTSRGDSHLEHQTS